MEDERSDEHDHDDEEEADETEVGSRMDAVRREEQRRGIPRTTTTGDPGSDVRQKDAGAPSDHRAHGRRGPYDHLDDPGHAWDPPPGS